MRLTAKFGKKLFLLFCLIISASIYVAVNYIESDAFARLVQNQLTGRIEEELGLSIEFSNLTVSAFPPGFAINSPKITSIHNDNKLGIPTETVFEAKKIGIALRMFQTFSSELVVNRFFMEGAKIQYEIEDKGNTASVPISKEALAFLSHPINLKLESGFSLNIRQVELRDSTVDFRVKSSSGVDVYFIESIKFFALRPEGEFYSSIVDLNNIAIRKDGKVYDIELFKANFQIGQDKINILSLDVKRDEATIHLGGNFNGDIRFPKKLVADVRVIARAKAETLQTYLKGIESMRGTLNTELHLVGSLNDYKVLGRFEASDFAYSLWQGLNVNTGIEISKDRILLSKLHVERNGGKIDIEQISLDPAIWDQEVAFTANFNNANFQDFCGELKTDVSNLEIIMNGSIEVGIKIAPKGVSPAVQGLSFDSNLKLSKLQLTNQTWGKVRPRKVIFEIPQIDLVGRYKWAPFRFDVIEGFLQLPTDKLELNGFVDNKSGWNLTGVSEKLNVGADIGSISNVDLAGVGSVGITVQGRPENVFFHFDLDLQDARYVKLNLGTVTGRVTLDDLESKIILKDFTGRKTEGKFVANGEIDLSDKELLDFKVNFTEADIDGILDLFRSQLTGLDWIPYGIRGDLSGDFSVTGNYSDPENTMIIQGDVEANRILYAGEIVSQLKGRIGIVEGEYFAKNLVVSKYNSRITGGVTYSRKKGIQYDFDWLRGRLRDIDLVSRTGIPINAKIVASGWGRGFLENFTSKFEVTIENAHVGTMPMPGILFRLDSDENFWDSLFLIGDTGNGMRIKQARAKGKSSNVELKLDSQDLGFVICMLNAKYCEPENSEFVVSGNLFGNWTGSKWKEMSGDLRLSKFFLAAGDYVLHLKSPVEGSLKNGKSADLIYELEGDDTEVLGVSSFSLPSYEFSYNAKGYSSLKILRLLTPLVAKSVGTIDFETSGVVSPDSINLNGSMKIKDGTVLLSGIQPNIERLEGKVVFSGNRLLVNKLEGSLGQGLVSVDGYVLFKPDYFPEINLGVSVKENKVRFYPVNLAEVRSGRLTLVGTEPPYLFSGKILLDGMIMRKNFEVSKNQSIRSAKYLPNKSFGQSQFYSVRINAEAERGIVVKNDNLDAEFSGELTLQNNFEFPQIVGKADLVKGKLLFRNTPFNLDHAVVRATNPLNFDPWFSIGGSAVLDSYRVTIFASGNASDPDITLGSSPPLPQEDILSLLAFGYIESPDGQVNPDDLNTITYTEVSSLLLDQLKLNKNLQSRGLNVRVAPEVIQNEANIVRPRAETDSAVPKIIIQTQVVDDIDASLGTTVGSSQSQQFDLNVEYHLNEKVSVQSVYEQEPGTEAGETRTSFGADLKFKWGFK